MYAFLFNKHLPRIYYMPVTLLIMSQILTHLIFLTTLSGRHYHLPPCTGKETDKLKETDEVKKLAQGHKVSGRPRFWTQAESLLLNTSRTSSCIWCYWLFFFPQPVPQWVSTAKWVNWIQCWWASGLFPVFALISQCFFEHSCQCFLFLKFIFNWRIIVLQCCIGFCHTTTCISYKNTYIPSLLSCPSTTTTPIPSV